MRAALAAAQEAHEQAERKIAWRSAELEEQQARLDNEDRQRSADWRSTIEKERLQIDERVQKEYAERLAKTIEVSNKPTPTSIGSPINQVWSAECTDCCIIMHDGTCQEIDSAHAVALQGEATLREEAEARASLAEERAMGLQARLTAMETDLSAMRYSMYAKVGRGHQCYQMLF